MNKNSHYKKISILLGLCVVVVFVGYYFLYRMLVTKSERVANMINYVSSESDREQYNVNVQKQLQALDPDIKRVENSIIRSTEVVNFIENLEALAHDNGLSIKNDSINTEEGDPKLSSGNLVFLKIKSTTVGSWAGTYRFLSQLESLPYKVRIDSFSITSTSFGAVNEAGQPLPADPVKGWEAVFEIKVLKYK